MRNRILIRTFLLLVIGLALFSYGCRDLLTKHNIDQKGAKHGEKLYKGVKNCTSCHGIDLDGNGFIPSCYSCHEAIWDNSDHVVNFGGVYHLMGVTSAAVCTNCHGSDYRGSGSRPSCYGSGCHDTDVWTTYAYHTISEHGYYHASGHKSPLTSGCTNCHGADLRGGIAQSCYNCHGNEWDGEGHDGHDDD